MKVIHNVYQIDAFTDKPFQGNPAGVVFSDDLTDQEMQYIAREMNLSETAFISKSDKADFNLRWFTPKMEVKLCGHATIASMHYLVERGIVGRNEMVTFSTLSGILHCQTEGGLYHLNLPIPKIEIFKGDKEEVLSILSVISDSINREFPFLLVDKSYLYIFLKNLTALAQICPDYTALKKLTEQKKEFDAVSVFTIDTFEQYSSAHLRLFAPYFGIDEDPVTGSANGPLLLVLMKLGLIDKDTEGKEFIFEQGDLMGRKGRVIVSYSRTKHKLVIAGNAYVVLKGELNF